MKKRMYAIVAAALACTMSMGLAAVTLADDADLNSKTLDEITAHAPDSLTVHSLAVKRASRLRTRRTVQRLLLQI